MFRSSIAVLLVACSIAVACGGDDDSGTPTSEAARRGVGSACKADTDCTEAGQVCLTDFKGGMCGIADCTMTSECPTGSVCVGDPDLARNFCLLVCIDKPDCNVHRSIDEEANCTSTLNQIDAKTGMDPKVCQPPVG